MGTNSDRVTVLVADDHPIYREGIVRAIKDRPDLELVAEAGDGRAGARRGSATSGPTVAVLDIRMPGLDGTQVLAAMRREGLEHRGALPLRLHGARARLQDGRLGRQGLPLEGVLAPGGLRGDRRRSRAAAPRFAAEAQAGLAQQIQERERSGGPPKLTDREQEVLGLVAEGLSAPDIGKHIHLSTTTVKSHLHSLYEKLGVSDRAAAVAEAMRRGLLD